MNGLLKTVISIATAISISWSVPTITNETELEYNTQILSTVMVLNACSMDTSATNFINQYVDVANETSKTALNDGYFLGVPYTQTKYDVCLPQAMVNATNKYITNIGNESMIAYDLTGSSFDELLLSLEEGPIVVWVTDDFVKPTKINSEFGKYYSPMRAIVMNGYNKFDNTIYYVDPVDGDLTIDYDTISSIYEKCGNRAMMIRRVYG